MASLSVVGAGRRPAAYLAARYSRRDELGGYAAELNEMGIQVTSRWLVRSRQIPDDAVRDDVEARRYAREDVADIEAADILVAFTEQPRTSLSRGGRHVELGYALAAGKRVVVVGPLEHIFCWLPQLESYDTWSQALRSLECAVTQAKSHASLATIIVAVADHYQVAAAELVGPGREALVVLPRQVAMWLCMRRAGASLPVVGRAFNRHHTTVLHALHRVEAASKNNLRFRQELLGLLQAVEGAGRATRELGVGA